MNWDKFIDRVIMREGGWADHITDKGGATNYGITLKTFSKWLDRPATKEELKFMTVDEAKKIYKKMYIEDIGLMQIENEKLCEAIFDWAVNSGPSNAIKALQRRLGVIVDGILGPVTAAAVNQMDGDVVARKLTWDRVVYIAEWMRNGKTDADEDGIPDNLEHAAGILIRIANLGRVQS